MRVSERIKKKPFPLLFAFLSLYLSVFLSFFLSFYSDRHEKGIGEALANSTGGLRLMATLSETTLPSMTCSPFGCCCSHCCCCCCCEKNSFWVLTFFLFFFFFFIIFWWCLTCMYFSVGRTGIMYSIFIRICIEGYQGYPTIGSWLVVNYIRL